MNRSIASINSILKLPFPFPKSNNPKKHKSINSLKLLVINKYIKNIILGIINPINLFSFSFPYNKAIGSNSIPTDCFVKNIILF